MARAADVMEDPSPPSLPLLLGLISLLSLSFSAITFSQDFILRGSSGSGDGSGGFPGLVALLAFITPLSGFLTGAVRAGALGRAPGLPRAPLRALLVLGCLLWGSAVLSTRASRHLAAPVSLAMKSVKILPTMVIAALWLRKRFSLLDWGAALLSAAGMALCLDGGGGGGGGGSEGAAAAAGSSASAAAAAAACATLACRLGPWLGAAQMAAALVLDGGAANAQEAVIRQFGSPPQELALYGYGAAALAALLHGAAQPGSESLAAGLQLAAGNPALRTAAALFAAGSCGATWCSLELIAGFGASSFMLTSALAKALVTTLMILAGKGSVAALQLTGIALVFSATVVAALAKAGAQGAAAAAGGEDAVGGGGLTIKLPGARAQQQPAEGGARAAHTLITPRTAGVELGLTPGGYSAGGAAAAAGLRRRGAAQQAAAGAAAAPSAAAAAAAAAAAQPPLQQPGTPLRKTLSSALSLVSAAALGIQRPQPKTEALSPVALGGSGSRGSRSGSAAPSPT